MNIRPRRSVLYMPGANARALEKSRELAADSLIFDLEDAVGPDEKEMARQQILDTLKAGGYAHRELIVRTNGLDTDWGAADLKAIAQSGAHAVLLPKVKTASDVLAAVTLLDDAGAPPELEVWIMAETAQGILNINDIAQAHERVSVIVMGLADLGKELRIPGSLDRLGFLGPISQCVLAARANGLDILDGVFTDLEDESGLRELCEQGRALGFDGKTLIHPSQIVIANKIFGPDAKAVEQAQQIVNAWEKAEGKGVIVVHGRMVEHLHVQEAQRTMAMAEAIAARTEAGA